MPTKKLYSLNYTVSNIATIIGSAEPVDSNSRIEQILIDSRKLYFPAVSLFFAIVGTHHDGHRYIGDLYDKGVRSFVVTGDIQVETYPDAIFLKVGNSVTALQKLCAYHRSQFHIPVIGITGSNGKTIVKELLYQLLSNDYNIVRSPKSYNSQVGVPLSVWQMDEMNTLGIFEAGVSLPGEMVNLEKIIRPGIGIFTFIGDAHAEGFKSQEEKISEKLNLFQHSDILFFCLDEDQLGEEVSAFRNSSNAALKTFTWGKKEGADLMITAIEKSPEHSTISGKFAAQAFSFAIPFSDDASIHNAITCCCILLYLKLPGFIIAQRMIQLKPIEMRLELKQGNNNCSIIDDAYSSDINSLSIALDFLEQQQQHRHRTIILSDMLQATESGKALYTHIAAILSEKKLHRFVGIGPQMMHNAFVFKNIPNRDFYSSTDDFLKNIGSVNFNDETILLKGARVFEFEKISNVLEQKTHQTLLEINLNALRHNLDLYRQQLLPGVKLMAMVKAFSYGSGSFEIANLLQYAGVEYLAVAYADEGIELRKAGIKLPIMVMNIDTATFPSMVKFMLEPEIYSFNILGSFLSYLQQHNISNHPVHIKLDTGMHRLGFEEKDLPKLSAILKASDQLHINSVFSHLVASDEAIHDSFTKQQSESFTRMANTIHGAIGYDFLKHISNTSAIGRFPGLQMDMVRLGIGLYGADTNLGMQRQLKTVATLKTTVAQIRNVARGESVGYSRKGILQRDSVIATVRIGYADGYRRAFGNGKGKMYINGQFAPVVGNVCMDMTMIDITGIPAREEDEVIVFGDILPVALLAKESGTIAYEILTNISQRVKRIYFEE